MSKVCRNETEYAETEAFYAEHIKLMAVQKGEYIIAMYRRILVSEGKTVCQGAVLKSAHYRPANLEPLTA